ncbi:MAG: hypothetical protein HY529_03165 [Chloroflexi bacterium]|nr:hypothetical protein [Chloroflexota bacterium]
MWYNGGMDTLSRMTLILAIATFLLAGAAFWSIWQNYKFRERDRKERLLNEIIEWAISIAESGIEPDTPDLSGDKDAGKSWPYLDNQLEKLKTLQLLRAKSVYMEGIASAISKELQIALRGAIDALRNQLTSLWEHQGFLNDSKRKGLQGGERAIFLTNNARQVENNNEMLYKSAIELVEKATKIKTSDVN